MISSAFSAAQGSEYYSNYEKMPAINKMPPLVATWNEAPNIIVCEAAPVEETRIRSAVKFWEDQGFEFGTLEFKQRTPTSRAACIDKGPVGTIVIHLVPYPTTMEATTLAQTHFYVDNETKKIRWAIINLRIEPPERVMEHELGHALGWRDYNQTGHIMHSEWARGGHNIKGLKK